MAKFYGAIDLVKNELQNAVMQNLGSAPSSPVKGQMYMNSTDNILYWYNGSGWVAAQGGAGAVPATTVTTSAVGDAGVVGVATTYAREDHKHAREAFGNVTAQTGFGAASGNGSAVTVARSDHVHGTPTHDGAAHSAIPLSSLAVPTGAVNFNGQILSSVGTPSATTDAANKAYVDNAVAGLAWKDSVRAATTANITLSAPQTIDGVSITAGQRVLVKNQSTGNQNGVYVCAAGAWTRATDADTDTELQGMAVFVEEGSTQAGTAWTLSTDLPITVGTTTLTYAQFGGGQTYTAGLGLVGTTTFDVGAGNGITVAADAISVDPAVVVRKYAAALTGTASPETVTHNLNTRDIHLLVYNGGSPYTAVEVDWDAATVNTATVRYNPNLGAGYRVVVFA